MTSEARHVWRSLGSVIAGGARMVAHALALAMIGMVRLYQILLSPLLGKNCRFTPTCSNYFILAVRKYGPFKGAIRGAWRICRCQPFNPGGYDPP